jgi:2-polyprenyl-3-methyl-5-hydroxy-6-metoxy-1,4-benzoquinol methylase
LADINAAIWDKLYAEGNFLHFPSEVFVQLYFRFLKKLEKPGTFLDHGCGSGNNSEFLARRGWSVTGSDVSAKALDVQKSRLRSFLQPSSQVLLDSSKPLVGQLQQCDHIVAWDSLCYNRIGKAKEDARELAQMLKPGGYMFINMPTKRHEFATQSIRVADGSFQNNRLGKQQEGAVMAIPESLDELCSWFTGFEVVERGYFTFDFSGFREFMVAVIHRPPQA